MEILLTSFGASHLNLQTDTADDLFHRMPPASITNVSSSFLPDFAVFLLCDRVIIDQKTYDRMLDNRHPAFAEMAYTLKTLEGEGFVRIEDFDSVITANKVHLSKMLERDLKELDQWVPVLKDSTAAWRNFMSSFDIFGSHNPNFEIATHNMKLQRFLRHEVMQYRGSMHRLKGIHMQHERIVEEALNSSKKRRKSEYRSILREELSGYLAYINANLVLSNTFGCAFHDWGDFHPFYQDKFLRVGRDSVPAEKEIEAVKQLFEISFPEFTFWRPKEVIRAIKDKRITEVRKLVQSAANGDVSFDREFATRTMVEVFGIETGMSGVRNIVSYLTMPLGFIPIVGTPIQKVTEEVITKPFENARKKDYRWFYLISETSKRAKKSAKSR